MAEKGLERILDKILCDAEAEAELALKQSQADYDAKMAEARQEAEKVYTSVIEDYKKTEESQLMKLRSTYEMQKRGAVLEAKQQILSDCYERVLQRLLSLDKDEYIALIQSFIKNSQTQGEYRIKLNKKDREYIGNEFRDVLSDECADITGGVIIESGETIKNYSFESVMGVLREKTEQEVISILF